LIININCLLPSAREEFDSALDLKFRSSMLVLVNYNFQKLCDFSEAEPKKYEELMAELGRVAAARLLTLPSPRNDDLWVNNCISDLDCTNLEDLTKLEIDMSKVMLLEHDFMKKNIPTFGKSFILNTVSQMGTCGNRQLHGEYIFSLDDLQAGKNYDDVVVVIPRLGPPGENANV
jgi:hypothetical protein